MPQFAKGKTLSGIDEHPAFFVDDVTRLDKSKFFFSYRDVSSPTPNVYATMTLQQPATVSGLEHAILFEYEALVNNVEKVCDLGENWKEDSIGVNVVRYIPYSNQFL